MVEVFLSLGSNVDREKHIPKALAELERLFGPLAVSSIYESEAVGFAGDPFFNLVVKFCSELPVREVARLLREIEVAHGRTEESRKFESRTLDIDLILYGDRVMEEGGIKLPRDEIIQFAFMLEPMAAIAPHFKHPVLGIDFARLWEDFDKNQTRQQRLDLRF
jgi:2-amino-4-hydroxy-6-hydroxymethyldihydropteridine diphosphokinase